MVLMVIDSNIKASVLKAIYESVGLDSKGQGIAFSLPVDATVGLVEESKEKEVKE